MGNSIRIAGANFTKVLTALSLPVRTDLIGEYVLGVDAPTSCRNLANASVPLLELGAPTYNANSAVVKSATGGYGFDTQLTPSNDCTMLMIRKPSSIPGALIAGSLVAASRYGFYQDGNGTNSRFQCGSSNTLHGAAQATPAAGTWFFQAGIGSNLGKARVIYYAAGVQTVVDDTNNAVGVAGRCYIGSTFLTSTGAWTTEVAYYAIYNRKLTPAEVDVAYQSLKIFFAARGIAI